MNRTTRRNFLKTSAAGGLAFGMPALLRGAEGASGTGPNNEIRVGVIGLGGLNIPGSVGGRGRQLLDQLAHVSGMRVVALCDVDQDVLDNGVQRFKKQNQEVAAYRDLRKLLDDKTIQATVIALPNFWHALAMIWACQADKDVYTEKPFCYNIWEGRQMVAAARKNNRVVQTGTQSRASQALHDVAKYLQSGQLGAIRYARAVVYRAREGLTKVTSPTPVPPSVDFDLWSGPIPPAPIMRPYMHYQWHWFWQTGNGEIGNNGPHDIDIARWLIGQKKAAPRAISIGGRFGVDDNVETANTQIALLDYKPAPIMCEVRNLGGRRTGGGIGNIRGITSGVVIECEGGYFAGASKGGAIYDEAGKKVKDIRNNRDDNQIVADHLSNFFDVVRSRKIENLNAEALEGHLSAAGCHMGNVSYRLGKLAAPEAIAAANRSNTELTDAFERCREHLSKNGVDLAKTRATIGPWITFDQDKEVFVGEFADQANALSQRAQYRAPFVVPKLV